jgi:hypothetical protein
MRWFKYYVRICLYSFSNSSDLLSVISMNTAAEVSNDFRRRDNVLICSTYYDVVFLNIIDKTFSCLSVIYNYNESVL